MQHKASYEQIEASEYAKGAWLAMTGLPIAPSLKTLQKLDHIRAYFLSECEELVKADQDSEGRICEQLATLWVTASL